MEVVAKRRKNDGSGSLHYLTSDIHANAQSDWPIQAQIPPAEWEISDCTERSLHIITHCYPMVFLSLFLYIIHLCAMCMLVGFRRWPHRIFCNIYIYNINSLMCGQVNKTTENKNRREQYNSTLLYENENNKQSREKRKIVAQPQYKMNTASRTTPKTTTSSSHHIEGVSARAHCAAEFIDPVAKKKNHKHKHRSVTIASTLTALFYYFSLWWEHTYTRTRPT